MLPDDYTASDSDQACAAGERATTHIGKNGQNKAAIFRFNPGKAQKVFPPKHPYLPKGCEKCDFKQLSYDPNDDQCRACKVISKCIERQQRLKPSIVKEYENGGKLSVYGTIDQSTDDFKRIEEAAESFAKRGRQVAITPKFDGGKFCQDYYAIYGSLKRTKYEGKCLDFSVNGVWGEHEGFTSDKPKKAVKNMLKHGLIQSERLILEKPQISAEYIKERIIGKIEEGYSVKEVWIKDGNLIYEIDF